MPWLKLDDGFAENTKIEALSDYDFRLHVRLLLYCTRNLTDGLVPVGVLRDDRAEVRLIEAGLWKHIKGGAYLEAHNFLEYNISKDKWLQHKKRDRVRKSRQRSRRDDHLGPLEPEPEPDTDSEPEPPSIVSASQKLVFSVAWNEAALESGLPKVVSFSKSRLSRITALREVCGSDEIFRAAIRAFHLWPWAREKHLDVETFLRAKNRDKHYEWGIKLASGVDPHFNGSTDLSYIDDYEGGTK